MARWTARRRFSSPLTAPRTRSTCAPSTPRNCARRLASTQTTRAKPVVAADGGAGRAPDPAASAAEKSGRGRSSGDTWRVSAGAFRPPSFRSTKPHTRTGVCGAAPAVGRVQPVAAIGACVANGDLIRVPQRPAAAARYALFPLRLLRGPLPGGSGPFACGVLGTLTPLHKVGWDEGPLR